jgi:hypothetical protein
VCGVTVDHTGSSFLEAWLRAIILSSIILGAATAYALKATGVIVPGSFGQLAITAGEVALALAVGLSIVVAPLAILLARHLGIPFSPRERIKAAAVTLVALAGCLVVASLAWGPWRPFRATIDSWVGGDPQHAVVGPKK